MFVYYCNLDEDQIKFDDQFMQKSRYFQRDHIRFLDTVCVCIYIYIYFKLQK